MYTKKAKIRLNWKRWLTIFNYVVVLVRFRQLFEVQFGFLYLTLCVLPIFSHNELDCSLVLLYGCFQLPIFHLNLPDLRVFLMNNLDHTKREKTVRTRAGAKLGAATYS